MRRFRPGDVVLIGSGLPHLSLNDKIYFEKKNMQAEAWGVYFDYDCFGKEFFNIPDLYQIRHLLEKAKVGLEIFSKNQSQIIEMIKQIGVLEGFEKVISLLSILNLIARGTNKPLSSLSFINEYPKSNSKLDKVYAYMLKNFNSDISLNDVADHVCMNSSAFSRFFKKVTSVMLIGN